MGTGDGDLRGDLPDVHAGFPDPARADPADLLRFLVAVDGLPGIRDIRASMRDRAPVVAGGTLIDVGCGPGFETERLAGLEPDARVVGLDHNAVLIAAARERAPDGPEWICADLADQELPAGCADVVRTERVLMYVPDLDEALDALTRLLAPGGRLACFELDYGATLLEPGRADPEVVRRAAALLEESLPQPWAGRLLPAALAERGLDVTAEPHAFGVDETVWRRIVHDTLLPDADPEVRAWLADLAEPGDAFRAAFVGVLTVATRGG